MLFSIVIICYNQKSQIATILESLKEQQFDPKQFEVIVVDDGSTQPAHADQISPTPYRLTYKYLPRCAQSCRSRTRNIGTTLAEGKYLVFLDGDTLPNPCLLQQYQRYFEIHRTRKLVLGTRFFLSSELSRDLVKNYSIEKVNAIFNNPVDIDGRLQLSRSLFKPFADLKGRWLYFFSCNFCIESKLFNDIGKFNESFLGWGMEDTELGYRIAKADYKYELIDAPTTHLRLPSHSGSSSPYHSWLVNLAKFYEIYNDGIILVLLQSEELMHNTYMRGIPWEMEKSDDLALRFFKLCERYETI